MGRRLSSESTDGRDTQIMGIMDDFKSTAETAGRKIREGVEDAVDRIEDKSEEKKAEADVKKAEADRDRIKQRNEVKEHLRDER
jgi:hypothetical protein